MKRNIFSAVFKAKVGCAALRENKTINELAAEHGAHPSQINGWRKMIVEESPSLFGRKNGKRSQDNVDVEELQRIVGEQAIKLAWYKKKLGYTN
jgi:transposase-like protein